MTRAEHPKGCVYGLEAGEYRRSILAVFNFTGGADMVRDALRIVMLAMLFVMLCALPAFADYAAGKRAWDAGRPAEALEQWRASADAGDRRAMLALGRLYMRGVGAPQDYVLAHMWLNLAAGRGEMEAAKERDALAAKMTPRQVASAQERARSWQPGGRTAAAPPPARAIREAQGLLAALGYEPGLADGRWSERTAKAYGRFLRDAGLPPGDTLTPGGLRAMRAAAKRQGAETSARAPSRPKVRPDALHRAVLAGNVNDLNTALKAGADVNARDARGWTALMHAANKGYAPMVGPLLKAKANVDARAADGATALFMSAAHGHSEVIGLLLKAGADPSLEGPKGKTAEGLMAARIAGQKYGGADGLRKALEAKEGPAMIKVLLDRGADVNGRNVNGAAPLHYAAAYYQNPAVPRILLDRGADVNAREKTGRTPLLMVVSPAVAKLLLDHGAAVNVSDKFDSTPLHYAALNRKEPAIAKLLLDRGAAVNAQNKAGATPLFYAGTNNETPAIATILLDRGASVNARGQKGTTPLHHVTNPAVAKMFLTRGAAVNARNHADATPLHFATNLAVVKILLDRGADVNARDEHGSTPLHYVASRKRNTAVTKLLLDRGADVNARNENGATPLHYAAEFEKNPEVVKILLDRGADANAWDGKGQTPLDYLSRNAALRGTEVHRRLMQGTNQSSGDSDTPSDNEGD